MFASLEAVKRSERASQARRELDRKFASANIGPVRARPRSGWIRAIRGALGMSQRAMAERMGIAPSSAAKLERSELEGGISIGKLAEVARALDCTLVYALVPNTSLEETVRRQAQQVAAETLGYVGQTMELEAQTLESDRLADRLESEAQRVIAENRQWGRG
jgi:predicted DNA-binding mobile mystery protein A